MDKRPVVIYGNGNFAGLLWYCLTHDSAREVVGFTVDRAFVGGGMLQGLPVLPFDELERHFPPDQVELLIALGYRRINALRRERFEQAKARRYHCASYVSSRAKVWPDLVMGENCLIFDHAQIETEVTLHDNVIVRSGARLGSHCTLGAHSFVAAQAAIGANVVCGAQAFVGVGAVVRDGLRLGERSFVGPGAVLLEDSEADAVYVGDPARKDEHSALIVTDAAGIAQGAPAPHRNSNDALIAPQLLT